MSELVIRQAQAGEFLEIAALDRCAWPDTPDTYIPDGEHVWRVWCEHATVLVAQYPQTGGDAPPIVGVLLMFPTNGGEIFLHKIFVDPGHRGLGIGSQLMQAALGRVTAPVLLTCDPANHRAVELYRRFGYEVRERVDGYYRPHEHRYVMVYSG